MKTCPTCLASYDDDTSFCPKDGTPLKEEREREDPLLGRTVAQRYLVLDKLGEGGFGTVYRVRDTRLDDIEALKVLDRRRLPSDRGQEVWERFVREAKVLRKLGKRSKHIVGATNLVHDEDADLFCYAMEYVEGENLSEILRRSGPMEPLRAVDLLRQLCAALRVAHSESVIHRDLKLENLMITPQEEGELLRVLDFGIAKVLTQGSLTDLSVGVPGTPGYTAPEQLENPKDVDVRADLFAVGVILFAMLTAREPWTGSEVGTELDDTWTLVRATMTAEPKTLGEYRRDVPKELGAVIARLLAKNPAQRFPSVGELDDALERIEQRLAGGGSVWRHVRKAGPALAGAALVVLGVFGWSALSPGELLSYEELMDHLQRGEVAAVVAEGDELEAEITTPEGSEEYRIPLTGRSLQAVMSALDSAGVPIRTQGTGSLRFEAVEPATGNDIRTPVVSLVSDALEGCEPCDPDEELTLAAGWYGVRPANEGWALDSLVITSESGYGSETLAAPQRSRVFVPGDAEMTILAAVSLTEAGRRARRAAAASRPTPAPREEPTSRPSRAESSEPEPEPASEPPPELLEEETPEAAAEPDPRELSARQVELDEVARRPGRYEGTSVRITGAEVASRLGRGGIFLDASPNPLLVKLPAAAAGRPLPPAPLTVVGTVRAMTDGKRDEWVADGAVEDSDRPVLEFASHYLDAVILRSGGDG